MRSGSCSFSDVVKDRYGTVYTPLSVINMVLDDVEKFYSGSLDTATICDPAIGDANFLVALYRRLTNNYTGGDPLDFSTNILSRLHGVEILDCICALARWRLVVEHTKFLHKHNAIINADTLQVAYSIVSRNIVHGNSLRTEDDTWVPKPFEGGPIPGWFNATQFDIIIANPPYLVYVSSKARANIPVPTKYKTTSLAHSFWWWIVEHVRPGGCYSLNIKRSILNSDSKVRQRFMDQVVSIHYNPTTRDYSMGDGGDVETLVFTASVPPNESSSISNNIVPDNSKPKYDKFYYNSNIVKRSTIDKFWYRGRLINKLNSKAVSYRYKPVSRFIGNLISGVGGGKACKRVWGDLLCELPDAGKPTHIAWGHVLLGDKRHQYKLINLDGISFKAYAKQFSAGTNGKGAVKAGAILEYGLLTWLWLNSSSHVALTDGEMFNWGLSLGSTGVVCNNMDFANCRVPDWKLYNDIAPEACALATSFAVEHIASGDTSSFDTGVDNVIDAILATPIPDNYMDYDEQINGHVVDRNGRGTLDNTLDITRNIVDNVEIGRSSNGVNNGDNESVASTTKVKVNSRSFYTYRCGCRDFKAKGGLDAIRCGKCGQDFVQLL